MKRIVTFLFALIFVGSITSLQAQDKKLSFGTDFGWANAIGEFSKSGSGGLNWNAHARYAIMDKLSVGVEYNTSILVAVDNTVGDGLLGASLWGVSNYSAKAWYNFLDKKVTPYAAIGLGVSNVGEPDITTGGDTFEGASRLGLDASGELGLRLGGVYLAYRFHTGAKTPKEPAFFTQISDLAVTTQNFVIGYRYTLDLD